MPVKTKIPDKDKAVLSAGEACGYLGLSWNSLKILVRSGEVRAKRVGMRYIFTRAAIDDYLNEEDTRAKIFIQNLKGQKW
ncbi:MAG: helix-turn-helix domain-containing protein [Nitrospirae bacterium]|nr:helix-turn-helix domain-containing protein [Nitrospirota bacterium]